LSGPGCRWIVKGRVQGVGFRWFVLHQAERLGVTGFVRNLPEGFVEVVGAGSANALAQFETAISHGPPLARVSHVEKAEYSHEIDGYKSFLIK
jgi:acylphosphatase